MRTRFLPLLLAATLIAAACSSAAPVTQPVPGSQPKQSGGQTQQPGGQPVGQKPSGHQPDPLPPPKKEPAIKWVVRTHFGPIITDDPAGKEQKVVLLTFDDGPHPDYTPLVLDTLKEHGIKALWFVTGNAEKYPDLIKRIDAEGHLIGTHTLSHENLRFMTKEKQREVITTVNEMVEKIIDKKPRYFRPPFGAYNENTLAVMTELHMQLMNWDHGSGDWMGVKDGYKDPKVVIADTLAEKPRDPQQHTALHPGSIILFHDTLKHTVEALPEIIKGLKEKGYDFVIPEP
jgi:peptidoglycan/xylan/chitin deacetylase (PgdA/CDA1 family)